MEKTFEEIKSLDIKVYQPIKGYRYNEDSFLLIDFIKNIKKGSKIIELCAGSGIIGLSLLKRFPFVRITFVEINETMFNILNENICINELQDRAQTILSDYRNLNKNLYFSFDYVVANPPYRKPGTGRISADEQKATARHELSASLEDLLKISSLLLKDKGKLYLVFLAERLTELINSMTLFSIEPKILQFVHPKKGVEAKLVLVKGIKKANKGVLILPPLFISDNKT